MKLEITVDASRINARLDRMPTALRSALRGTVVSLTQALAGLVRAKLSGGVLNVRSGNLLASINSQMVENTSTVYGRVFVDPSSPAAKYARIHEFGGVIKHPGSSKFQAWQSGDGWVYTHFTRPHDIPMPERSYLRSSLAEMREEIVTRLSEAARSAGREAA